MPLIAIALLLTDLIALNLVRRQRHHAATKYSIRVSENIYSQTYAAIACIEAGNIQGK